MPGRVSVIIPAYNSEKFIAEAIRSVLRQTYADLEILIIDDGSTDATGDVARGFSDPRIKYIRRENGGTAAARNTGIKNSTGVYIAFLDHDDIWMPDKIERQVGFLEETGAKAVFCNGIEIPSERPMLADGILETGVHDLYESTLSGKSNLTPSSLLINKEAIEKTRLLEENIPGIDDWDFSISLARNYTVGFINEYLYNRREHGGNLTGFIGRRGSYFKLVYEKQKPFLDARQKKIIKRSISNELFNWARKNMSMQRLDAGLESWAYSVRFGKSRLFKLPSLLVRYLRFKLRKVKGGWQNRI